jgi:hypothetical protein
MENMAPIIVLLIVGVAGKRSCGMAITSVPSVLSYHSFQQPRV